MPRVARIVVPGLPHHVTQRGNYSQTVFDSDGDKRRYLLWVKEYSLKYRLSVLAYCIMSNHVHFIVIPQDEDSMARTFNTAHMRYSQYRNRNLNVAGHLWQGRFFSCVMDERHLIAAARYIERNPVRAGVVKKPWDYVWSSASDHAYNQRKSIVDVHELFDHIEVSQDNWKSFVDGFDREEDVLIIKKHTMTGMPMGSGAFVERLEGRFGKVLRLMPAGRPRRAADAEKNIIGRCP